MTETSTGQVVPTTADLFARFREVPAAVGAHDSVFGPLRAAIQASLDVHHMPIPDDAPEEHRQFYPPTEILDRLRERYATVEVPPCRVCGAALSIQDMGGGNATKYAHSKPDGVSFGDWAEHYEQSRWTERRSGDSEVIAIVDLVQSLLDGPTSQAGAES
jgi:hypothetical protein